MHWGSFVLTDEPLDEPPRRLLSEWSRLGLPASRLALLAVGESFAVAAEWRVDCAGCGQTVRARLTTDGRRR
jgi:hypothetical protein